MEIAAKDKIDAFAQQARVLGLPQAAAAIEAAAEDEARHGKVLAAEKSNNKNK